jgi:hypothetical protein
MKRGRRQEFEKTINAYQVSHETNGKKNIVLSAKKNEIP